MDELENFIDRSKTLYTLDSEKKSLILKSTNISDNNVIKEMLDLIGYLDKNEFFYRVGVNFNIRLYRDDDKDNIVVSLDENGKIIHFNTYATVLTGYNSTEVMGNSWFDVFIPDDEKEEISEVFKAVLRSEMQAWHHINDIICKDGTLKEVEWNNFLIKKNSGDMEQVYAFGVVR